MSNATSDTLRVTTVSYNAAIDCLDRVCALRLGQGSNRPSQARAQIDGDALPVSRLIDIANESGLEAKIARLDWDGLREAAANDAVLLLLKNANVVAVIGNGFHGPEEIVASDPLNHGAGVFYFTRTELEPNWSGDALIVAPLPKQQRRSLIGWICVLWVCAALGAAAFLLPRIGERNVVVTTPPATDVARLGTAASSDGGMPGQSGVEGPRGDAGVAASGRVEEAKEIAKPETAPSSVVPPATSEAAVTPEAAKAPALATRGNLETPPSELSTREEAVTQSDRGAAAPTTTLPAATIAAGAPAEGAANPAPTTLAAFTPAPAETAALPPAPVAEPTPERAAPVQTTANGPVALLGASIDPLIARGDALVSVADIVSARSFYERAAETGNGLAALRLGETYDPHFLARARLGQVKGDRAVAAYWYRRARDLGVGEAETLLGGVESKGEK